MNLSFRYAYLHGFGSGPQARKGTALRDRFARSGVELWLPDLNRPSAEAPSAKAMLAHLEAMCRLGDASLPWRFVGSSMGGWLAAKFTALHPDLVERQVLLCPAFGIAARWKDELGEEGALPPEVPRPTLVIHGTRDETVPIEGSRRWVHGRAQVTLLEVDDDHALLRSIDVIEMEARRFFA